MRIVSQGIDIVLCARIERIWRDHGDVFLQRVFTDAERAYCLAARAPAIRLAGRFAAKEAVLKALGTGWRGGIQWTDIEILPDPLGKPLVTLAGTTAELARRLGIDLMMISISHAGEYAAATALGLSNSE